MKTALFLFYLCLSAWANADTPTIEGAISNPECQEALLLANTMYNSASADIYVPLLMPIKFHSTLLLGQDGKDDASTETLYSSIEFEVIDIGPGEQVYWGQAQGLDKRLVLVRRGDHYWLYLVAPGLAQESFLQHWQEPHPDIQQQQQKNLWHPPFIFRQHKNHQAWWIAKAYSDNALQSWGVYNARSTQASCLIVFQPSRHVVEQRVPAAVHTLLELLDSALGPGNDEGTLQPTARIRYEVAQRLPNLTLRPWALADDAYNSRKEVDAALQHWAQVNSARARHYRNLQSAYAPAEQALAKFYAQRFGITAAQSQRYAQWAIDVVYRSYFVFPKQDSAKGNTQQSFNPWPQKKPSLQIARHYLPESACHLLQREHEPSDSCPARTTLLELQYALETAEARIEDATAANHISWEQGQQGWLRSRKQQCDLVDGPHWLEDVMASRSRFNCVMQQMQLRLDELEATQRP